MRGEAGHPVRLRFAKRGPVRFISHRDVARAFERAFRIVTVPIAFTGGFSPRPKVSFGLALSVGHESEAEYLDVELTEPVATESLVEPLTDALPEGVDVTGAALLEDRAPALQEAVSMVSYRIEVETPDGGDGLAARVGDALASPELVVTRRRKGVDVTEDVRPSIRSLRAVDPGVLFADVGTHPRGLRPGEVVAALGGEHPIRSVLRTHQWIERDGARREPLDADTRVTREGFDVRRDPGTRGAHDDRRQLVATTTRREEPLDL